MPKLTKRQLTEEQKIEAIAMYTGEPKISICKIGIHFRVGTEQVIQALDEAGVPRKRNKKRTAASYKDNEPIPEFVEVTMATAEFTDYLLEIMSEAGKMDGITDVNFSKLLAERPFKGVKRVTVPIITKAGKAKLKPIKPINQ